MPQVKISVEVFYRPLGFPEVEAPQIQESQSMKVVKLSALRTSRLYPPRKYCWYLFLCWMLSRLQGPSEAGEFFQ